MKAFGREGVKALDLRGDCPQNIILYIKLLCYLFIDLLSYVKVRRSYSTALGVD